MRHSFRYKVRYRDRKQPGLRVGKALADDFALLYNFSINLLRTFGKCGHVALELLLLRRAETCQLQLHDFRLA